VVDNASDSPDAEAIRSEFPEIHVVRSRENRGFAGGTNLGVAQALEASDAQILLLNNDVAIEEGDVVRLLDLLEGTPDAGVLAPVLYHGADRHRILSAGSRSPVLHRFHSISELPERGGIYEVASVSGAAVLIRPAVFRRVGMLDESYFFATEMADFCRRAAKAGYRTFVDSDAKAYHDIDRSTPLRETLYVYYVVRNRFLFIRRFHPFSGIFLAATWALYGAQQALRLHRSGRHATAKAISMGVVDGLRGRFGGQNPRVLEACRGLPNQPRTGM
jgi:GT2 family glycosyltransferase